MSYVSDSEDEQPIPISNVLRQRVAAKLVLLSHIDRQQVTTALQSHYNDMFTPSEWADPQAYLQEQAYPNQIQEYHQAYPHNEVSSESPPLRQPENSQVTGNENQLGQAQEISLENQQILSRNDATLESNEDQNNLRIYLDARNYETGRRGLRKRNFASTHPYLNDQAHYLGLADVNYLNELYEKSHNVESIVKYLNRAYIGLKSRYPKDEKYRSKNFYTILGKQTRVAREAETQDTAENPPSWNSQASDLHPSQASWEQPSEERNNNEADFRLEALRECEFSQSDLLDDMNESNEESPDEESPDEESPNEFKEGLIQTDNLERPDVIRVGGRLLKERSALRGTLPESFKHLDLYKAKERKKRPKKKLELRRGLAVRKMATRSRTSRDTVDFITDDVEEVDINEMRALDEKDDLNELLDASERFKRMYSGDRDLALEDSDEETSYMKRPRRREKRVPAIFPDEYVGEANQETGEDDFPMNIDDNGAYDLGMDGLDMDDIRGSSYMHINHVSDHAAVYVSSGSSSEGEDATEEVLFDDQPRWKDLHLLARVPTHRKQRQINYRPHFLRENTTTINNFDQTDPSEYLSEPDYDVREYDKIDTMSSGKRQSSGSSSHTPGRSSRTPAGHRIAKSSIRRSKSSLGSSNNYTTRKSSPQLCATLTSTGRFSVTPQALDQLGKGLMKQTKKSKKPLPRPRPLRPKTNVPMRQYTIPLEAESTTKFVKPRPVHKKAPVAVGDKFPHGFISNTIDVTKVYDILTGKSYILELDSASVTFSGELYIFTLVDTRSSAANMDKLLSQLIRTFRTPFDMDLASVYEAVHTLIKWVMISQSPSTPKTWGLLDRAIRLLARNTTKECFVMYPYFCLLWMCMKVLDSCHKSGKELTSVNTLIDTPFDGYWKLFFRFGVEAEPFSKELESLCVMHSILDVQGIWWKLIDRSMNAVCAEIDMEAVLDGLALLAFSFPGASWRAFYSWYDNIGDQSDSRVYSQFMDTVQVISQRLGWKIDEKMVLKLYSTVAGRRFANFDDEWGVPQFVGRIRSRFDIPSETFFERFMQLFYSYISDMAPATSKKRLITKLITSSHYQYQKDKAHFVMFTNRVNFLMLLVEISEVELKKQLWSLVQSVLDSGDVSVLDIAILAIGLYTEIAVERSLSLPVQALSEMIKSLEECYSVLPGAVKLVKSVVGILKVAQGCEGEQVLEVYTKVGVVSNDKVGQQLNKVVLKNLDDTITRLKRNSNGPFLSQASQERLQPYMFSSKDGVHNTDVMQQVNELSLAALNLNMGRFPLPSMLEEQTVTEIVETLMRIWVRSTSLLGNANWTRITLQTFPYVGNVNLRHKFELLYYFEVLRFTSLKQCQESVVAAIMRSLAAYTPSVYLPQLMNRLNRDKNEIIMFQSKYIPEEVTSFHLQNLRSRVILNVLTNIENTTKVQTSTKKVYLQEFLGVMSSEFDKYFASQTYKEFCLRSLRAIQRHCFDYLDKNGIIKTCTSKLGMTEALWDKHEWTLKAPLNKLAVVHRELSHTIQFERNIDLALERYVCGKDVTLIYDLVSIYLRLDTVKQACKWRFIYAVLLFFNKYVRDFKFHITSPDFMRFLHMLTGIKTLESNTVTKTDTLYFLKTCYVVADVLRYAKVLFNGYRDIGKVKGMIAAYQSGDELEYYSSLELPQIDSSNDSIIQHDLAQEEISIAKNALIAIEADLNTEVQEVGLLDYEFSF